ncbi:MAG: hypothetical protein WCY11_08700 [Novosphingobium sp.]
MPRLRRIEEEDRKILTPDEYQTPPVPSRQSRPISTVLFVVLLAFLAGAALVGWLAFEGRLSALLPGQGDGVKSAANLANAPREAASPAVDPVKRAEQALGGVETRLALLEERLSRITVQADAASGNATRAESLLVVLATRRMIDRGQPLGYLEQQLRLRFGDAQPNAVETIIQSAQKPVTMDELVTQLDAAGLDLAQAEENADPWSKVKREFASLFVIRRDTARTTTPENRLAHARLLLTAGKVDQAITEVERLPGATGATQWVEAARRYSGVQRALDLIETAAMLQPATGRNTAAERVDETRGRTTSDPAATPAPSAAPPGAALPSPAPASPPTPSPAMPSAGPAVRQVT